MPVPWSGGAVRCTVWFGYANGRKCFFIEPHSAADWFGRDRLYGYGDDAERFAFFSKAALEFMWQGLAIRYHGISLEAQMTDVLIRDIPDDVIAALDAHAARLGLSRSEYVRRRLAQDAAAPGSPVSVNDLARFATTFADLADPDVMSRAWT